MKILSTALKNQRMANKITITKTDGGVPRSLPGQDHYSGIMMYLANADLPAGFSTTARIKAVSTIEDAVALGITSTSTVWAIKALHYHLSECFRINPSIVLYVGLFLTPTGAYDFAEIKTLQSFAENKLRQISVYCYEKDLSSTELTALQAVATVLDSEFRPAQLLYTPKITNISSLSTSLVATGLRNVSVLIGQDGAGTAAALYTDSGNSVNKYSVGIAGLVLGMLSLAKVHESIAYIEKFPSGITEPAFSDNTLVRNVSQAAITALDDKHYLFLVFQGDLSGSWLNDSYTMDLGTSDYAYIEANRSMDKAIRGIRTYLLPKLSGPLYVDPTTGKLNADDVAYLQVLAGKQLEDMKKAKELSGYEVSIDPDQNVLSTSKVTIVINKVGVGVMRQMEVYINNTTSI